jgi:hypothetical protein
VPARSASGAPEAPLVVVPVMVVCSRAAWFSVGESVASIEVRRFQL